MIARFYMKDGLEYDDISGERIYESHRPHYDRAIPQEAYADTRTIKEMIAEIYAVVERAIINGLYQYFGNNMRIEMKNYGHNIVEKEMSLLPELLDAMGLEDVDIDSLDKETKKRITDIIDGMSAYYNNHKQEFVDMVVSDEIFGELKDEAFAYFIKKDPFIDYMLDVLNRMLVHDEVDDTEIDDLNHLYEHPNEWIKPSEVANYVATLRGAIQQDKLAEYEQILTNPLVYQYSTEIDKFKDWYGI